MQQIDSVRKISTSVSALETEIIFNLLSLPAEIKENHFHLHTLIWTLDWTFRARGLSLELDISCSSTTAESRAKIWYQ